MKSILAAILIGISCLSSNAEQPTKPPLTKFLGEGDFTGRQQVVNGELLAEVLLHNGQIVWVVIPK